MWTALQELMEKMMLGEIKEVPYSRDNYIIRKKWWIEHYIKLCNQEIEKNCKKRKNNGNCRFN